MSMLAIVLISLVVFIFTFALGEWLASGGSFRRSDRADAPDNELRNELPGRLDP